MIADRQFIICCQPISVGEVLTEKFIILFGITQGKLASAMGVSRKTINEICNNKRSITVDTALMLVTAHKLGVYNHNCTISYLP